MRGVGATGTLPLLRASPVNTQEYHGPIGSPSGRPSRESRPPARVCVSLPSPLTFVLSSAPQCGLQRGRALPGAPQTLTRSGDTQLLTPAASRPGAWASRRHGTFTRYTAPNARRQGCWTARELPATAWGRSLRKHAPSDVSGRSSRVDHVERMTVERVVPLPAGTEARGVSPERQAPGPAHRRGARRRPGAAPRFTGLYADPPGGPHCGANLDVDLAAMSSKRGVERKVSHFTATRTSPPSKRASPGRKHLPSTEESVFHRAINKIVSKSKTQNSTEARGEISP